MPQTLHVVCDSLLNPSIAGPDQPLHLQFDHAVALANLLPPRITKTVALVEMSCTVIPLDHLQPNRRGALRISPRENRCHQGISSSRTSQRGAHPHGHEVNDCSIDSHRVRRRPCRARLLHLPRKKWHPATTSAAIPLPIARVLFHRSSQMQRASHSAPAAEARAESARPPKRRAAHFARCSLSSHSHAADRRRISGLLSPLAACRRVLTQTAAC